MIAAAWLALAAALQVGVPPAGSAAAGPEHPARPSLPSASATTAVPSLADWLGRIAEGLGRIEAEAASGHADEARQRALRLYLDEYELLETHYGAGGERSTPAAAAQIGAMEVRFHELLRAPDPASAGALAGELRDEALALRTRAGSVEFAGSPASPSAAGSAPATDAGPTHPRLPLAPVRSPEIAAVVAKLEAAEASYRAGRVQQAQQLVERAYLDGIEPLESRLPQARVHEIERLVHLGVRASMGAGAPAREVLTAFGALRAKLLEADTMLVAGAPAWLGAANAFIVLVREGLEAVLLVAALLGYLAAVGAGRKARSQIYGGVAAGVAATLATWGVATLLVPIGGGSRELVEGITGLLAVAVLLYVSNWLFQKTYVHDWKDYLRQHLGRAVTAGSGLAMGSLAFAAVYREGFETVLFYQALLFDAGPRAVLAGAVPGAILIGALGVGIIRLGVKLPLARMFAFTNAILLYLAFTFVGKGLYNLQEAGVFTPHALPAFPDGPVLRQLLGLYPLVETTLAQLLFAAVVAATYVYYHRRAVARRAAPATRPPLPAGSAPSPTRAVPG